MKSMTIPELHEALKSISKKDLILDVRTPQEFAAGHIPNAKNIPVDQVMNHAAELTRFETIYIYCRSGGRVMTACSILAPMGVKNMIAVDDGGFPDWEDLGYPTEK
jgi:rhodanese-related sulfurtransferase